MLAMVDTMHELVRSMSKVNSDRLKQSLRLNGGWPLKGRNIAIAYFHDNQRRFYRISILDVQETICTVRDESDAALAWIKAFVVRVAPRP